MLENWDDWGMGDVDALAADVLSRCETAAAAWHLESLTPLTGGNVALVLAAGDGAVLKLSPRPKGEPPSLEGAALAAWSGVGAAPRVLGVRDEGSTLLLERVRPGDSLGERRAPAVEVVARIGALCRRLHLPGERVAEHGFPTLAAHAEQDGWHRALEGTREQSELAALLAPEAGDRLLHVDLHALNVLRGSDGWLAIDPKPCLGDPCAEIYGFLDGAPLCELPRERAAARRWLRARLADHGRASGDDADRLAVWLRIRAQILLGEGEWEGEKREPLLRICDVLG